MISSLIYSSKQLINHPPTSVKAAAATIVSQLFISALRVPLRYIRRYNRNINATRFVELRGVLSLCTPLFINSIFFKNKNQSTRSINYIIKDQPFLTLLYIANCIVHIQPIRGILEERVKTYKLPQIFIDISNSRLLSPMHEIKKVFTIDKDHDVYKIYNNAINAALIEELFFRGIFQELFLKQLPKFILKSLSIKQLPPEILDFRTIQIIRISLSALFFGIPHLRINNFAIVSATLSGLEKAILQEKIGLHASILSHFNHNFFTSLSEVVIPEFPRVEEVIKKLF